MYVYHIFFIHSSTDEHLGCFHVLAIADSAAVNTGVHVSFWIIFLPGYMSRSGIAESHSNPIFRFLRNLILFYIMAASTYIPTNSVGGVPFSPHPLTHFLFVDFLKIYGHSDISVWWHFIVALICISVIIISKVGHLFMCLLVICMFSSEKHLFWSSALFFFFNWIVCFFCLFVCLRVVWAVYIFLKLIPLEIIQSQHLQIFSVSAEVVFLFHLWFPLLCKHLEIWLGFICLFLILFLLP